LSVGDAEVCLDALADMHAAFWESPELKGPWLTRPSEGIFQAMIAQLMVSGVSALSRYESKVPARVALLHRDELLHEAATQRLASELPSREPRHTARPVVRQRRPRRRPRLRLAGWR
jgi:hypothetical protein